MIQKGVQPGTDEVYLMNRLMRVHLLLQFLIFFPFSVSGQVSIEHMFAKQKIH